MGNIKPKELSKIGYTDNVARSLAIELVAKHCKHYTQEEIINLLQDIHLHPDQYKKESTWGRLAEVLSPTKTTIATYEIFNTPIHHYIFGEDNIVYQSI